MKNRRTGFTLMELGCVMMILAVAIVIGATAGYLIYRAVTNGCQSDTTVSYLRIESDGPQRM